MLCEGLTLLLIDKGIIRKSHALEVIDGLVEIKQEIAGMQETVVVSVASIALLKAIVQSVSAASGPAVSVAGPEAFG